MNSDDQLSAMQKRTLAFVNARDWSQFHTPKDLAMSLTLEAAELLEHFQWKSEDEIRQYLKSNKNDIAEEMVDYLHLLLLMSHYFKIDLADAFYTKMIKNEAKYPVEKAKGSHKKYSEL